MLRHTPRWLAAGLSGFAACFGTADYHCADSQQCRWGDRQGTCRADGYCSYPDPACPSGERYSDQAGTLASACVEDEGGEDGTSTGPAPTSTAATDDDTGVDEVPTRIVPVCGDGVRDGGEACDDGNRVDADGCNADCVVSGTPRWSPWDRAYSAAPEANARFADVDTRPDGTAIAIGTEKLSTVDAALLVLWDGDGEIVWARHYDVAGATDVGRSVTAGVGSEIFASGHSTMAGATQAWLLNVEPADGDVEDEVMTGQQFAASIAYMHVSHIVVASHGFGATGVRSFNEALSLEWTAEVSPGGGADAVAADGVLDVAYYAGTIDGVVTIARADPRGDPPLVPLWEGAAGSGIQGLDFRDTVLVAGGFEGLGMRDAWVATIDTARGGTGWTFTTRLAGEEEVEDVAIDATGAVVAVGFVTGAGQDARVWKLGPDGTLLWQWEDPLPNDDVARAVAVRDDGDIVLVGDRTGSDGATDAWITRLSP